MHPSKPAITDRAANSKKSSDVAGLFGLAQACHRSGHLADAEAWYEKVLTKRPNHFGALHLLGLCKYQAGNHEAAARLVKRAHLIDPQSVEALSDLGVIMSALKRQDEALQCLDRLIELKPDFTNAYYNRGNILLEMRRFAAAIASFDKAIEINPRHASTYSNRGNALFELGQIAASVASYDKAIEIAPDHIGALLNRGEMLLHLRQPEGALASFKQALRLNQNLAEAWLGYAVASLMIEKVSEALAACHRALAIRPDYARALVQLGQCHALQGDAATAVSFFDRALAIEPDHEVALSSKIFALDFSGDADFAVHQRARSEWWRHIGAKIASDNHSRYENDFNPDRRIVLGYVSAEFNLRSASYTYRPVLQNHDRTQFEIVCYSNHPIEDQGTSSFRQAADRWRNVFGWLDDQVADCIRADKIDILIDLSGHSEGKRLEVFARKPAPVQVTAWGHATGTGLPTIDYLFSDPISIPEGVRHLYAEQIYDLPCALIVEPPPASLRCKEPAVLSNGYLTYGVFNRISKISAAAVSVWSRIMRCDGTARLLIKHQLLDEDAVRGKLLDQFAAAGIALDRISLLGFTPREQHLAAYGQVDICLDPFPNGGGVSTWEALYMGVPVVAKLGNGMANRVAGAILTATGMSDWVAADDDQYVEIALRQTPEHLRTIRDALPDLIQQHCGPIGYTRAVEKAYRSIWRKACEQAAGSRLGSRRPA